MICIMYINHFICRNLKYKLFFTVVVVIKNINCQWIHPLNNSIRNWTDWMIAYLINQKAH